MRRCCGGAPAARRPVFFLQRLRGGVARSRDARGVAAPPPPARAEGRRAVGPAPPARVRAWRPPAQIRLSDPPPGGWMRPARNAASRGGGAVNGYVADRGLRLGFDLCLAPLRAAPGGDDKARAPVHHLLEGVVARH